MAIPISSEDTTVPNIDLEANYTENNIDNTRFKFKNLVLDMSQLVSTYS